MRQVAAVRQAHPQNRVARSTKCRVDRRASLGARMALNVGIIVARWCLGTLSGQAFALVYILAATVVALAGVTFGVLVGQFGTLSRHHQRAGVVFRGTQCDVLFLTATFGSDG